MKRPALEGTPAVLPATDPREPTFERLGKLEPASERVIVPAKSRIKLSELRRDLPVVRVLAARDFKVKYKQSLLGPLWLLIQPLGLLVAFFVAFRGLADVQTGDIPYALFALVGLSVWAFFQASLTIGTTSLVTNVHLVKLTPCPRLAFPIASLVASLPAVAVTTAATLVLAVYYGSVQVRATRHTVGACLAADAVGMLSAVYLSHVFF